MQTPLFRSDDFTLAIVPGVVDPSTVHALLVFHPNGERVKSHSEDYFYPVMVVRARQAPPDAERSMMGPPGRLEDALDAYGEVIAELHGNRLRYARAEVLHQP